MIEEAKKGEYEEDEAARRKNSAVAASQKQEFERDSESELDASEKRVRRFIEERSRRSFVVAASGTRDRDGAIIWSLPFEIDRVISAIGPRAICEAVSQIAGIAYCRSETGVLAAKLMVMRHPGLLGIGIPQ